MVDPTRPPSPRRVPPGRCRRRDPVAAQQCGDLRVAVQGGQPRVDVGCPVGRWSTAADHRCRVVVKGPQHRLDGAVQVRGDLRELHRRSWYRSSRSSTGSSRLPVHDLPPTRTLRGGPHRMRHHPGQQPAAHPASGREHTPRRPSRPGSHGHGSPRSAATSAAARAERRSTAATSIGRPGAAPR